MRYPNAPIPMSSTMPMECARIAIMLVAEPRRLSSVSIWKGPYTPKGSAKTAISVFTTKISVERRKRQK
jgi:hypothetical protein